MITDKEYPATHSMATAWFAIDDAGEVAMLNFDDNGPVPQLVPQTYIECILQEKAGVYRDGIYYVDLTSLQAREMLKTFESDDELTKLGGPFPDFVQIRQGYVDRFLQLVEHIDNKVCFSKEERIYFVDFGDVSEKAKSEMVREKMITAYRKSGDMGCIDGEPDWFEQVFYMKGTLKNTCEGMPFYLYHQTDYDDLPMIRLNEPEYPLKASQVSPYIQNNAVRISGLFSEMYVFQIACHTPVKKYDHGNHNWDYLDDETPVDVDSYTFPTVECGYSCHDCHQKIGISKTITTKQFEPSQGSDEPTIIILDMPGKMYWHYDAIFSSEWLLPKLCYVPLVAGVVYPPNLNKYEAQLNKHVEEYSIKNCFLDFCHKHLEHVVDTLRPYVIIAEKQCQKLLYRLYEHEPESVTISGVQYDIIDLESFLEHGDRLLTKYRNLPYRGKIINRTHAWLDD